MKPALGFLRDLIARVLLVLLPAAPALAAPLPMRAAPHDAETRRMEIAAADLSFAISALKAGAAGSGAAIGVNGRPVPADVVVAALPADQAWAATVARAVAIFPVLAAVDPPRDIVAQNFDGWYAVSAPGYGRLVGIDPDQVLGALLGMIGDPRFGNGLNPGVDWQPQIGIMGRISLAVGDARGQGLK